MQIENTTEMLPDENLVLVEYGRPGVGKTTFAASAPAPLILDFENGTKYLGQRGFSANVIRLAYWLTKQEKQELALMLGNYKTVVVDPLGEAMDKLIESVATSGQKKFVQSDGSLTMAGWGEAKKQMKSFIKFLRDSGKNVILVSHVTEKMENNEMQYRIQIATKLVDEIPAMVDVITYLGIQTDKDTGATRRILYTPAQGGNFDSKDRTGRIPKCVEISEYDGFNDLVRSMKPLANIAPVTPAKEKANVKQPSLV